MFIEILFKMLLFKGGVLIYAEHCIYTKNWALMITSHFNPQFLSPLEKIYNLSRIMQKEKQQSIYKKVL